MLPFRPPPLNGMPAHAVNGGGFPPRGIVPPPGVVPGMIAMRGPPPRGPPPMMGFPPGCGPPPPQAAPTMTPREPTPVRSIASQSHATAPLVALQEMGPISLFVGKLPTALNDSHVRNLLEKCGHVVSWKRTQDPVTSKPLAFGYCTYVGALDALRALRLLDGFSIGSTQIVVKADKKTHTKMEELMSATSEARKRDEQERDNQVLSELKCVEDEHRKLKGDSLHDGENRDESPISQARNIPREEQDETPATTQGDASDDQDALGDAEDQHAIIQSAIGKLHSTELNREQELNHERVDAAQESIRGKEEQPLGETKEMVPECASVPTEISSDHGTIANEETHPTSKDKIVESEAANGTVQKSETSKVVTAPKPSEREHDREHTREREKRDRGRDHRKRVRSHSRSHSRGRSSRRKRRSRSYSRSHSRERGREARRDRKRGRESDRRRRRRRNSSNVDEDADNERRTKRRRDSRSESAETPVAMASSPAPPKPVAKVVMDLKMSLGVPKKEKVIVGPAASLFKVEDELETKPVRDLVKIDFAEEDRQASALAQQKAIDTAAKINRRSEDVKTLIDSIPTDKAGLFAFPIQWDAVEANHVIKDKMVPWVTKKVVEYLGEEDATLINFILKKLSTKAAPDVILDELQAILEDEAEVFVKSLWRKLAFEALRVAA